MMSSEVPGHAESKFRPTQDLEQRLETHINSLQNQVKYIRDANFRLKGPVPEKTSSIHTSEDPILEGFIPRMDFFLSRLAKTIEDLAVAVEDLNDI